MKNQTPKYFVLARDIGNDNLLHLDAEPIQAESRAQFALDAIERLGYTILEIEPLQDPNQTTFDF